MIRLKEMTLEEQGFDARQIAFLLLGAVVAGALIWIAIASGSGGYPRGAIGYRHWGEERWIDARGDRVQPPPDSSPRAGLAVGTDPQAIAFPAPAGDAVAYVRTVDEGAWFVTRLMVRAGGREIELGQLGGGAYPPLITGDKAGARSRHGVPLLVAWSPDGQWLAWGSVVDDPFHLNVARAGEWESEAYALQGGYAGEMAWSPDSRYLAVSTYGENRRDHTLLIFDTASPGTPRVAAKGCVIVWAPDSRHIALHGEPATQPGLWVVSVGGGSRKVVDEPGAVPFAWVSD